MIEIRKVEIERRRGDFKANKAKYLNRLEQSLIYIKESSTQDSEIPKTYHMLAEIEKVSQTVGSTNSAISYLQR